MSPPDKLPRRAALLLPLALAGCGFDFSPKKLPLPGKREPVLPPRNALSVSPNAGPVTLPPPEANRNWAESGRVPGHALGNLAASTGALSPAWSVRIGAGGGYRRLLTAQPLVVDGRVFTMDSEAVVAAFDLASGRRLWRAPTRAKHDRSVNVGGGIAYDAGTLYAATGLADAVALDPAQGKLRWRAALQVPARSAPTVVRGKLFVCTIDGKLRALDARNGHELWNYQASAPPTTVLGQPAPAVSGGTVVAGFGSGDLAALQAGAGAYLWGDNLGVAGEQISLVDFSAIIALPVIEGTTVYTVGLGGLMTATDLRSGRRLWERDLAADQSPCLAGDWIFVVTTEQRLAAIRKADGMVAWITDLPRWRNVKKSRNAISWVGPILAGNRLLLASDDRQILAADPVSGRIETIDRHLSSPAAVSPIVASGTVLLLTDDGRLTALR